MTTHHYFQMAMLILVAQNKTAAGQLSCAAAVIEFAEISALPH
jgi:hypothetical protein